MKSERRIKLSDLKAGDHIVVVGFDCMEGKREVFECSVGQLYLICKSGRHYLDGQVDADGYLVGIHKE